LSLIYTTGAFAKTKEAFVPPKPNEFDKAAPRSLKAALFAT